MSTFRRGLLASTVFVVMQIAAWNVSIALAEMWNGWVDEDGDWFLDPFVNGSYDWVDVNGPTFVVVWLALQLLSSVVTFLVFRIGRRRSNPS